MFSQMFSSVNNPDILLFSCLLAVFLGIGALYDAHGALVPDTATVPYAVVGLTVAAINQRWVTLFIGGLVLLYIFSDKTPKCLRKLSNRLLMHSYKTMEAIEEDISEKDAEADAFEQKHGGTLWMILSVCFLFEPLSLAFWIFYKKITPTTLLSVLLSVCIFIGGMYYINKGSGVEENPELSAFGGADVLILIGMLGYYGVIGFVFAVAATFFVQLIWCVLVHFIKREKVWKGIPLLPMMFFTIPLRLYVVNVLFYETVMLYNLSFRDVLTVLTLAFGN